MSEHLMAEGPVSNAQHSQHKVINTRAFVSRIMRVRVQWRLVKNPENSFKTTGGGVVISIKS